MIVRSDLPSSELPRDAPSSGCTEPRCRRKIPVEARVYAEENDIRPIGVDRPGIGSSTPLPDAELYHLPGESHLAGLGRAEDILRSMIEVWDRDGQR